MSDKQLLHTFEERISAAGQERRQVGVDLGAHLATPFPTLQLNTGARDSKRWTVRNKATFNITRTTVTALPW